MIKTLLVDDHQIVRAGIKRILAEAKDVEIIDEVDSGEEALSIVHQAPVDVVLMDVHMPGVGGLEATRRIVHYDNRIKVLVLTVSKDEIFPVRFLKNGASGYLTKDCSADELLRAVRQVYGGQRYLSAEVAQQLALKRFDDNESPFEVLSERELQVMLMITQGVKVPQIADQLHLSNKTVNTYRYRIFNKLTVNSDVELTHLALRYGMIDSPQPDAEESA